MRKWVLMVLSLPCVVACASVLGLEDAELDEEGGSCNYGPSEVSNTCIADCWNSDCCGEAVACFDDADGRCSDYLDCLIDCDSDAADCSADCTDAACLTDCTDEGSACGTDCATTFREGARLSASLTSCTALCNCPLGNGNGNGGAGAGGSGSGGGGASGRGGAGPVPSAGAGPGGRGGAGPVPTAGTGGGGNGAPCTAGDPSSCVSSSSVRLCVDGVYETETCSTLCSTLGFRSGPCAGTGCECGAVLDAECDAGTAGFCLCAAADGDICTPDTRLTAYVGCYTGDPTVEPVIRCLADYYAGGSIDCPSASICLP